MHCHRLNPVAYWQYCMSKFGRIIDYPLFSDVASESLAQERCKRLWSIVYHKEPYDMLSTFYKFNGSAGGSGQVFHVDDIDGLEDLIAAVTKQPKFYLLCFTSIHVGRQLLTNCDREIQVLLAFTIQVKGKNPLRSDF